MGNITNYEKYNLIIRNGSIVSSDKTEKNDIGIIGEKIVFIGNLDGVKCQMEINAEGKYVLPGVIDGHMHVEAPMCGGLLSADDYYTQSISAAFGGVTTFMDFTNTNKGDSLIETMNERLKQMEKSCIDYALHGRIVDANDEVLNELKDFVDAGCPSFKMYMTYREDGFLAEDDTILKVFDAAEKIGALCLLHCESNPIIEYLDQKYEEQNKRQWWVHAASKPVICEAEAAYRAISFSKVVGNSILLVHTTNGEVLKIAKDAQLQGHPVYIETCPHYLILDDEVYNKENGHLYICSPPLRKKENIAELWDGIMDGTITVSGSDDCAFTRKDKEKYLSKDTDGKMIQDYKKVVSGMSGLEMRLPVLITEGVLKGKITLNKIVELTSTNLAKLYGMYPQKGSIQAGSDADLIIIDMSKEKVISKEILHNNVGYTAYEGMAVKGIPDTTILRGKIIVDDEKFFGNKNDGKFVKRKIDDEILKKYSFS